MEEIKYREAHESDINELVDLWWLMQESHDSYDSRFYSNLGQKDCKKLSSQYFADLLKKETCMIFVASMSGKIVGLIMAHFQSRPPVYTIKQEVEVELAIVHPEHRENGIFRNLLKLIEQKAKLNGINLISLTVDSDNTAKFAYEATGFGNRQDKMIKWI